MKKELNNKSKSGLFVAHASTGFTQGQGHKAEEIVLNTLRDNGGRVPRAWLINTLKKDYTENWAFITLRKLTDGGLIVNNSEPNGEQWVELHGLSLQKPKLKTANKPIHTKEAEFKDTLINIIHNMQPSSKPWSRPELEKLDIKLLKKLSHTMGYDPEQLERNIVGNHSCITANTKSDTSVPPPEPILLRKGDSRIEVDSHYANKANYRPRRTTNTGNIEIIPPPEPILLRKRER